MYSSQEGNSGLHVEKDGKVQNYSLKYLKIAQIT